MERQLEKERKREIMRKKEKTLNREEDKWGKMTAEE